jgi:enoyl-CoA hydratase
VSVQFEILDRTALITIDRPEKRNAVDSATARALFEAFERFDRNDDVCVAVLTGAGDTFCAGADLKEIAAGTTGGERLAAGKIGPMGPTRMTLSKPVIAAIEGYAVAGGLELCCWADLRVAARSARFGVLCRRFGVPLVDLGTIRLPRLIGHSRAMDLILTGREIDAGEAERIGLVNRLVDDGQALNRALALAEELAEPPQTCLRGDRLSAIEQWSLDWKEAMDNELRHGLATLKSGETRSGAERFSHGGPRSDSGTADKT